MNGEIKTLVAGKRFGFIKRAQHQGDLFFHESVLGEVNFDQLKIGDKVSFKIGKGPKGECAVDVRPLTAQATPPQTAPKVFPPFRFAAIDSSQTVLDSPVWHDGSGKEELFCGEIRCTLTARTPLLAGNDHYAAKNVKDGVVDKDKVKLPAAWGGAQIEADKQVVEPLRWNKLVLIAGSALKGMIRHSLSALLQAPMERVQERHYTYRPNLEFKEGRLKCRPAVVVQIDKDDTVHVKVLDSARAATFVETKLEDNLTLGTEPSESRVVVSYRGGIDGEGLLAKAFRADSKVHRLALVPVVELNKATAMRIPTDVMKQYFETQKILGDNQYGHLAGHPALHGKDTAAIKKAIETSTELKVDQLIYVELQEEKDSRTPATIRSIGHHVRYRWAYTSSIRKTNGKPRAELTPHLSETETEKPAKLSGARLLFGYVHDHDTPIGKGVYERLAGRIACNHALSETVPEFLNADQGCCVFLPILGQPRPSAMEFYLKQDINAQGKGRFKTYGDLLADAGGELAGRKFYLHQPQVQKATDIAATADHIPSKQATLARFVCAPGTVFRFSIRFAALRPWELGALLATLEPARLDNEAGVEYAHKLGLGRPLGFGSVTLAVRELHFRRPGEIALQADRLDANDALAQRAIAAFRDHARLDNTHLQRWFDLHRYCDRGGLGYPLVKDLPAIYAWHTQLRRKYSESRRSQDGRLETPLPEEIHAAQQIPPRRDG